VTVALACFVTGLITGWFIRTVAVMGEASRAQERMQNKVRYWQSEAIHARYLAAHLARQLSALGYTAYDDYAEPPPDKS
jgi:hypothetical protein